MGVATITQNDTIDNDGFERVRLTTGSTSDTYKTTKFNEIIAAVATNRSDTDGVGVAVSSQTVTITVATAGDVVDLLIAGRL